MYADNVAELFVSQKEGRQAFLSVLSRSLLTIGFTACFIMIALIYLTWPIEELRGSKST